MWDMGCNATRDAGGSHTHMQQAQLHVRAAFTPFLRSCSICLRNQLVQVYTQLTRLELFELLKAGLFQTREEVVVDLHTLPLPARRNMSSVDGRSYVPVSDHSAALVWLHQHARGQKTRQWNCVRVAVKACLFLQSPAAGDMFTGRCRRLSSPGVYSCTAALQCFEPP